MADEQIFAVALVTRQEADLLGPAFDRLWPVEDTGCFNSLLQAIDEADREVWRRRESGRPG